MACVQVNTKVCFDMGKKASEETSHVYMSATGQIKPPLIFPKTTQLKKLLH
jgi:hypothetical protein